MARSALPVELSRSGLFDAGEAAEVVRVVYTDELVSILASTTSRSYEPQLLWPCRIDACALQRLVPFGYESSIKLRIDPSIGERSPHRPKETALRPA